ncbi:hypothetical protein GIB67_036575 [Kingdonia uniflora]|uniref:HR-like lesion-inducer n=1 Tax=Kingdonia uniflora TaxID=39325 RepID=A0A7J7ME77_9MAGN|nr:hypothetical protein GIB67_036575 [Kingdonia uniflora]
MGFTSFVGRVLFASLFILSAWQEYNDFGDDGGYAAKALGPKYDKFTEHITSNTGIQVPGIDIKHLVLASIAFKAIGGFLFIFGSSLGAYLLLLYLAFTTPILYDFYNYDTEKPQFLQLFVKFTQDLALFGALFFFLSMKSSTRRRVLKKRTPKAKTN